MGSFMGADVDNAQTFLLIHCNINHKEEDYRNLINKITALPLFFAKEKLGERFENLSNLDMDCRRLTFQVSGDLVGVLKMSLNKKSDFTDQDIQLE